MLYVTHDLSSALYKTKYRSGPTTLGHSSLLVCVIFQFSEIHNSIASWPGLTDLFLVFFYDLFLDLSSYVSKTKAKLCQGLNRHNHQF